MMCATTDTAPCGASATSLGLLCGNDSDTFGYLCSATGDKTQICRACDNASIPAFQVIGFDVKWFRVSKEYLRWIQLDDFVPKSFMCMDLNGTVACSFATLTQKFDWSFLFVALFILAGGLGNILVCLAIAWERRLQNVTNYFLLSLAIADLLVSLFVMPMGAIQGFLGKIL